MTTSKNRDHAMGSNNEEYRATPHGVLAYEAQSCCGACTSAPRPRNMLGDERYAEVMSYFAFGPDNDQWVSYANARRAVHDVVNARHRAYRRRNKAYDWNDADSLWARQHLPAVLDALVAAGYLQRRAAPHRY
jgi:hypothetical protein